MSQSQVERVPPHLAASAEELTVTDFEQSLICAAEAFYRCIGLLLGPAAREHRLSGEDNVILQQLMLAEKPRGVTELSRFANRDDFSNIQYSLRKLTKCGLVEKVRGSTNRETAYRVTAAGRQATETLVRLRRELLVAPGSAVADMDKHLAAATNGLLLLTGLYDHTSRVLAGRD